LDATYLNATLLSTSTLNAGMGDGLDSMDDLRSYEAAVIRNAPTMWNLKVKRPMRGRGRGGEGSASASSGNSPRGDTTDCSSSSSLANAFGTTGRLDSHSQDETALSTPSGGLPPKSFPSAGRVKKEQSASPTLSSPASSAEGDDNLGSLEVSSSLIGNTGRPSFKRLPSQTLGPDNSKRPFYGIREEVEDRVVSGWGAVEDDEMVNRRDGGVGSAERRMRKRRMSEPSTILTGDGHGREDKRLSRVDVSAVQNVDGLWFGF